MRFAAFFLGFTWMIVGVLSVVSFRAFGLDRASIAAGVSKLWRGDGYSPFPRAILKVFVAIAFSVFLLPMLHPVRAVLVSVLLLALA
jgi:hypothetical protein